MNWIGGARARAKFKVQLNANGSHQKNRRRSMADMLAENDDEDDDDRDGSADGVGNNDGQNQREQDKEATNGGRKRKYMKMNDGRTEVGSKTNVDYEALGYVSKPQNIRRRVVPLLEFVEKKFPYGHVLSLHMNVVMDITRTPASPSSNQSINSIQRPHLTTTSTNISGNTSLTTSSSSVMVVPQPGPSRATSAFRLRDGDNLSPSSNSSTSKSTNAFDSLVGAGVCNSTTSGVSIVENRQDMIQE